MKFNWGTGIAIVYTLFAGLILLLVFKSRSVDRSLVVDDYYAKDLKFQEHYDKMKNSLELRQDIKLDMSENKQHLKLTFPVDLGAISGEIEFYNPAFQARDFTLPIQLDGNGSQVVSLQKMRKGRWKIKINWEARGKGYYFEKDLFL